VKSHFSVKFKTEVNDIKIKLKRTLNMGNFSKPIVLTNNGAFLKTTKVNFAVLKI
jgi:hypothetical protein